MLGLAQTAASFPLLWLGSQALHWCVNFGRSSFKHQRHLFDQPTVYPSIHAHINAYIINIIFSEIHHVTMQQALVSWLWQHMSCCELISIANKMKGVITKAKHAYSTKITALWLTNCDVWQFVKKRFIFTQKLSSTAPTPIIIQSYDDQHRHTPLQQSPGHHHFQLFYGNKQQSII